MPLSGKFGKIKPKRSETIFQTAVLLCEVNYPPHHNCRTRSWRRHQVQYIVRQLTGLSYPKIGRLTHCEHSTVIAGCRKVSRHLTCTCKKCSEFRRVMIEFMTFCEQQADAAHNAQEFADQLNGRP